MNEQKMVDYNEFITNVTKGISGQNALLWLPDTANILQELAIYFRGKEENPQTE